MDRDRESSDVLDPASTRAEGESIQPARRLFNRELSWLHFNARVLRQAADPQVPLLERLNFLSIFTSNLDEFFMKRVGGLKRHLSAGIGILSTDGLTPKEELRAIRQILAPQIRRAHEIYLNEIKPELASEGIEILSFAELNEKEQAFATRHFETQVFPLLTPLAVDAGHPFPFLSNLSMSIGVALHHPDREEETLFARVKINSIGPGLLLVNPESVESSYRFIPIHELVEHNLDKLFPDMKVLASMLFRVTRSVALEVDEEDAEDLRELMEEELRQRKRGMVVRLEHGANPDPWILSFLREELTLHKNDIYEMEGELDYTPFSLIGRLPIPELKFPQWTPVVPPALREEMSFFNSLRSRDILVHHPYESFSASVERFVREAVDDPKVRAIKMTVYRVGDETPIIPLLIKAAERGKNVICLVELKARFDEERNIQWAQQLEDAGVHVIYGIAGLKIHAKVLLVIREELDQVRAYAHVGTGNYHSKTANLYTDFGLFTSKESYTRELLDFFNFLTGRSKKSNYEKMLVAPVNMFSRFLEMIEQEIRNAESGKPAEIIAKMNSLEDKGIIEALYRASAAGVRILLLVRGVCCLRPGVSGMSENITVISVVGRLLEHSRLFYFRNGESERADGLFFIGSADWMSRNLHRRIELVAPVEERSHKERFLRLFDVIERDRALSWILESDGSYTKRHAETPEDEESGTHETIMKFTKEFGETSF